MHADFQALLALRDGTPVSESIASHVEGCDQCTRELERLAAFKERLRSLPSYSPPSQVWQAISQEISPRESFKRWPSLTAVAAVMLLITVAFVWVLRMNATQVTLAEQSGLKSGDVVSLMADSQRLEALLHSLPPRPPVEKAVTSATIDELQSRIELVDFQLSQDGQPVDRAEMQRLWNARVQLLNSLVYVRYAEVAGNVDGSTRTLELGVI
jgi:hypothetical protein